MEESDQPHDALLFTQVRMQNFALLGGGLGEGKTDHAATKVVIDV